MTVMMTELEKYTAIWNLPAYHTTSPGERIADFFLDLVKPNDTVIDFGCGTGRAAKKINDYGVPVLLLDLVTNSRDGLARKMPFIQQDFTKPIGLSEEFGFCSDIMEHIPTNDVELVIKNIMQAARTVFFQINLAPDGHGASIGQTLHMTVRPAQWWIEMFVRLGYEIRFKMKKENDVILVVTNSAFEHSIFWKHGKPWKDRTVAIIASGPSTTPEHAERVSAIFPTMTLNDMYVLAPEAQILYGADLSWWAARWVDVEFHDCLKAHKGTKVGLLYEKRKTGVERLKYLKCTGPEWLDYEEGCVRHGLNTGYSALNLAMNLGAKKIILVGYDMKALYGRTHCHLNHVKVDSSIYQQYVGLITKIAPLLLARGVEVVNTSTESALECFPKMEFNSALDWGLSHVRS